MKSDKELFDLAKMYVVLNNELQRRLQPEYEIDEIPIPQQRILADLNQLAKREVQLLEKLAAEKEKYYDHVIAHVHNELKRGN